MTIEIKTAYGPKENPVTINNEVTMTKQSLAANLDVNNIIKRYTKTGILLNAQNLEAVYGEITSMDLREALEKVSKADEMFSQVPSKIRAQFDNDAGAFIDFATNPANIAQMREWGFANPEPLRIETPPDPPKA